MAELLPSKQQLNDVLAMVDELEQAVRIASHDLATPACRATQRECSNDLRTAITKLCTTPETPREPPGLQVYGALLDQDGWICSVCHYWNHTRDRVCMHSHLPSALKTGAEPRCTCADFDGFTVCPVHI